MSKFFSVLNSTFSCVGRLIRQSHGGVSPMMALLLLPLLGMMGFAAEGGGLFMAQRGLQNAADSAALAAATNNCITSCGTTYDQEARAVAKSYGFQAGVGNVVVTSTANVPCPTGGSNCYRVRISKPYQVALLRAVGFAPGVNGQTAAAEAVARPRSQSESYCLLALATGSGNGLTINGGGSINLNGCDVFSNSGAKCNGSNGSNNYYGISIGNSVSGLTSGPCGATSNGGQAVLADPYAALATPPYIPANTCTSPGTTTISGAVNWSAYTDAAPLKICGDLKLGANVTITTSSIGSAVIIEKGNLVLNSKTLTASTTSGLTFIFSGAASTSVGFATGSGTLDFGAPKSGHWSGVALYQNPALATSPAITYTGNSPTLNITGLIYAPNADFTVKGAINHQTAGLSCMALVAKQITISGGGWIFANTTRDCVTAGLNTTPVPNTGVRQALVQ